MKRRYHYFAYGSNMLTARLRARCPCAEPIGRARLDGFRIDFTKRGGDGSGKATIHRAGQNETVFGVIFSMALHERPMLDGCEGFPTHYERIAVTVDGPDGMAEAETYIATEAMLGDTLLPLDWYHALVLTGALEHGLPADYVASLYMHRSVKDRDTARALEAWSLLAGRNAPAPDPQAAAREAMTEPRRWWRPRGLSSRLRART